jgi:hypothetical protein
MFGTTFTTRPRVLDAAPADAADLLIGRAGNLVGALAAPGRDERRLFAKAFYERRGYRVDTAEGRTRLRDHLLQEVTRVGGELATYASAVARSSEAACAMSRLLAQGWILRTRAPGSIFIRSRRSNRLRCSMRSPAFVSVRPENPSSRMRSVGYQTVQYSNRADDGDHIVFYQRRGP